MLLKKFDLEGKPEGEFFFEDFSAARWHKVPGDLASVNDEVQDVLYVVIEVLTDVEDDRFDYLVDVVTVKRKANN